MKLFPVPTMDPVIIGVAFVGQKQIMRRQLANIINVPNDSAAVSHTLSSSIFNR